MELYPIFKDQEWGPTGYIIIEEIPIPSMCPEYDPGPPADCEFPEYWEVSVTVAFVDIHANVSRKIGYTEMHENYKWIQGRSERIAYWRCMKYMKAFGEKP
jgi:hypothetical protein